MKFFHLCKCLSYLICSLLAILCERKQSQCLLSDGLCKTAKSQHQQISITNVNLSLSEPYCCIFNVGFFMKYIHEVDKLHFTIVPSSFEVIFEFLNTQDLTISFLCLINLNHIKQVLYIRLSKCYFINVIPKLFI